MKVLRYHGYCSSVGTRTYKTIETLCKDYYFYINMTLRSIIVMPGKARLRKTRFAQIVCQKLLFISVVTVVSHADDVAVT